MAESAGKGDNSDYQTNLGRQLLLPNQHRDTTLITTSRTISPINLSDNQTCSIYHIYNAYLNQVEVLEQNFPHRGFFFVRHYCVME